MASQPSSRKISAAVAGSPDQAECASCGVNLCSGVALCSIEVKIDCAVDRSRRERKRLLKVFFFKVRVVLE